jgi:leucyl-tRNA synthetase
MSKSRGNVVNPDEYIDRYGADALRMYLMFLGPYDQGGDFRDTGMAGMYRFLERVWKASQNKINGKTNTGLKLQIMLQKTIKKVTEDIGKFKYNTAIASLMEFMNVYEENEREQKAENREQFSKEDAAKLFKLFAPFAPYITEEIWHRLYPDSSGSIHSSQWPEYDSKILEGEQVEIPIQINGKTRAVMAVDPAVAQSQSEVVKVIMDNRQVSKYLENKKIVKIIFVANKIINLIIS